MQLQQLGDYLVQVMPDPALVVGWVEKEDGKVHRDSTRSDHRPSDPHNELNGVVFWLLRASSDSACTSVFLSWGTVRDDCRGPFGMVVVHSVSVVPKRILPLEALQQRLFARL